MISYICFIVEPRFSSGPSVFDITINEHKIIHLERSAVWPVEGVKQLLAQKLYFSKSYIIGFIIHPMEIRKQLRDILALIAELAHNNVNEDVRHTLVIDRMELPEHETHKHIHKLESLGLIKIQPRMNRTADEKGREYRLLNVTREGLQELSSDQMSS